MTKKGFIADLHLDVWCERWGHAERYGIERTTEGWKVSHFEGTYDCNSRGRPYLYTCFANDSIAYPSSLPTYLADLWNLSGNWGKAKIQKHLNVLGRWISATEARKPARGIWYRKKTTSIKAIEVAKAHGEF